MKITSKTFSTIIDAKIDSVIPFDEIDLQRLSVDSRSMQNGETTMFFALVGKNHDGHEYIPALLAQGVRYFVVSQRLEGNYPEDSFFFYVEDTLSALHKVGRFYRMSFDVPVIGITGSKGKTIVKEWLNFLLDNEYKIAKSPKSYNSQTGVPLSVSLLDEKHTLGVFEVGISERGEMRKLARIVQPTIGVFTAVTEEHAMGFSSIEEKISEKVQLFSSAQIVICPYDDRILDALSGKDVFTWSLEYEKADVYGYVKEQQLMVMHQGNSFAIHLALSDPFSVRNTMTCVAVMLWLGYSVETISARVATLFPVELRLNVIQGKNNCVLIDDVYNADFHSLIIALDFLEKHKANANKTVVLSDLFHSSLGTEDLYTQVADLLSMHKITRVIGIGEEISNYFSHWQGSQLYKSTEEFLTKVNEDDFNDEVVLIKGARAFRFDRIVSALEEKTHETILEVDLDAVRYNLNYYRSRIAIDTKVMVMVKAFGYGNGSVEIAKLLAHERVDYLGVAFADEGVALRKGGINTKIIVMNPELNAFSTMIAFDLEPEIYSIRSLQEFLKVARAKNSYHYPVHIKLDTGMHRHGFGSEDIEELIAVLKDTNIVEVKTIFSHLAASDEAKYEAFTLAQIKCFEQESIQLINALGYRPIRHILNTSGIFNYSEYQFDMVRLGIGLYGIGNSIQEKEELQNVSTLKSIIMQIKRLHPGESVGYSRRFTAENPMRIATVPIGYADGIHRRWGNEVGYVLVNGQRATILGSICMDMMMVDVTTIDCNEGDEIVIFGEYLPVSTISEVLETIPYEILTSISQRVKRIFYQS